MPLVSILIATYKRPDYLDRCLASVLSHDFKDYEILILDDHPDEQTEAVVKKYELLFSISSNYRYIRNNPRLLYYKSLNRGLREAKGEYIAILDDDDAWPDTQKLKKQVDFLNTHPDYVLIGTGMILVDQNGIEFGRALYPERDNDIREKMLAVCCFAHSSVMYRKSIAMSCGGYSEKRHADEYELWLNMGTSGKMANLPIFGLQYTTRNRGILHHFKVGVVHVLETISLISKYKRQYPHYWRARNIRCIGILAALLYIVSEVPPFVYLKKFVKNKSPVCWKFFIDTYRTAIKYINGLSS